MKPDIKGLMKLGRYLKRLPKQNFNQGHWLITETDEKGSCGTTGCVAGHAAILFPHRFKRVPDEYYDSDAGFTLYDVVHRRTGKDGTEGFAAGFRIPEDEAYKITDGGAHRNSPKVAANAIFKLVNRLKKAAKK